MNDGEEPGGKLPNRPRSRTFWAGDRLPPGMRRILWNLVSHPSAAGDETRDDGISSRPPAARPWLAAAAARRQAAMLTDPTPRDPRRWERFRGIGNSGFVQHRGRLQRPAESGGTGGDQD